MWGNLSRNATFDPTPVPFTPGVASRAPASNEICRAGILLQGKNCMADGFWPGGAASAIDPRPRCFITWRSKRLGGNDVAAVSRAA